MIKFYNVFNKIIWIFLIYVVGDVVTTYLALPYGSEGNPLISWVLTITGFTGLIILKIVYVVFIYYTAEYLISRGYLKLWNFTANTIIIMGIIIMINNIYRYLIGIGMI